MLLGYAGGDFADAVVDFDSPLFECIAVADCYRAVLKCLCIDGDAIRCAYFILPAISPTDGRFLIVEHIELLLEGGVDFFGDFGHSILLNQWQNCGFDRREPRVQTHNGTRLHFTIFVGRFIFVVRLA